MPVILLQRLPLPSLRTYTAFSVALLASAVYYAHIDAIGGGVDPESELDDPLNDPENPPLDLDEIPPESVTYVHAHKFEELRFEKEEPTINFTEVLFPSYGRNGTDENVNSYGVKMASVLLSETWCIWSLVNMACCCLILLGRGIQKIVFGDLRVSEQQHLRDKFWNFAFYKFIFIFGVMNVQSMEEVVLWSSWFSVLACLHLLAQLCKDRFEYLSFSPATPTRTHLKVLLLLIGIQTTCAALLASCLFIGYLFVGLNIFAFMTAEVFLLMIKTSYVMVRYAIHLWDLHHDSVWENRAVYIYYSELIFELIAISVDFCNHLHMLVWSNIFLSMASLVICMQLRYLFHELQRRIRRHKNYLRVVTTMDEKFKMATLEELEQNDDDCSICWERMRSARKLPCGHFFHNACLRSWLEQDTSCPICRKSVMDNQPTAQVRPGPPEGPVDAPPPGELQRPPLNQNMMTNHFFHFDASRYVSWLPSFSVEVSHTQIMGNRHQAAQTVQTSQLDNMARQVQEVFPHIPLATALGDLQLTRSIEMTIENIVEGRLVAPPTFSRTDPQDSDSDSSGSGSEDSDSSTGSYSVVQATWAGPEESSGGLYDPLPPPSPASPLNFNLPDTVPQPEPSSYEPIERAQHSQDDLPLLSGYRFSKSPTEREAMLEQRKENMLQQARRRFLTSGLGGGSDTLAQSSASSSVAMETRSPTFLSSSNFSESGTDSESGEILGYSYVTSDRELDAAVRRERAFLAAQRRLQSE